MAAAHRRASTLLVAAALTAAGVPAPGAETVPAPVAVTARASAAPIGEIVALPALLQRVLARDPQVQVAQGLYGVAQERLRQLRSRMYPVAGLSLSRGQATDLDRGFEVDRRTERSEALLRWNAYNGGSDAIEITAAQIELDAAIEDLRRAREEAAERIAGAYLELLRFELLIPRAAGQLEEVERLVQQVRRQAELGRVSQADFEYADTSRGDAEIVYTQIVADRDGAQQRLAALTSEPPLQATADGLAAMIGPQAAAAVVDDLPGSLRSAQLRAQAARERVRSLTSVLAPRVDLEARYALSDKTTPPLSTETKSGWTAYVRWEVPLGGESFSRRNEIERRAEANEAEAQRLAQGLRTELAGLAPRIAHGERAVQSLDRQLEQYDRLLRAGELQFEAGRRSVPQLIQLRDARFNVEQRRADQVHRLALDRLRQLALNGGLLAAVGQPRNVNLPEPQPLVSPPPYEPLTPQ